MILLRPAELRSLLEQAELRHSEDLLRCVRITPGYRCDGGGGGGAGGPKDAGLAAYVDSGDRLDVLRHKIREAEKRLIEFLKDVEAGDAEHGKRDALLLRYRYLRQLGWNDTMQRLQQAGYRCTTERTVYNWHGGAIRRCEALLSKETET